MAARRILPLLYAFPGKVHPSQLPATWQGRFSDDPARVWGLLSRPLHGTGAAYHESDCGPAGPCLLVWPGAIDFDLEELRYVPGEQSWLEIESGAWLGIHRDARPLDFMREAMAPNIAHGMYDPEVTAMLKTARGEWVIPIARLASQWCQLPLVETYQRGQWTASPAPHVEHLAADALTAYRAECGEITLTAEQRRDIAIRALQCNYALTGPELGAMGALSHESYIAILAIITDLVARKKKARSATPTMTSGAPGACPTIALPSTTSNG